MHVIVLVRAGAVARDAVKLFPDLTKPPRRLMLCVRCQIVLDLFADCLGQAAVHWVAVHGDWPYVSLFVDIDNKHPDSDVNKNLQSILRKCYTRCMKIGFAREIPRLALAPQVALLEKEQCYRIWKNESLNELISTLRKGEILVVSQLPVLSTPQPGRTPKVEKPRHLLRGYMKDLAAKGAHIREAKTGREFKPDQDCIDAIFDAIDHWSGNSGRRSKGRPKKHDYTDDEWKIIDAIWTSRKFKNAAERVGAIKAHSKRFEHFHSQAYYEWNKRQTKEGQADAD